VGSRILVADAEPPIREVVRACPDRDGHEVAEAEGDGSGPGDRNDEFRRLGGARVRIESPVARAVDAKRSPAAATVS